MLLKWYWNEISQQWKYLKDSSTSAPQLVNSKHMAEGRKHSCRRTYERVAFFIIVHDGNETDSALLSICLLIPALMVLFIPSIVAASPFSAPPASCMTLETLFLSFFMTAERQYWTLHLLTFFFTLPNLKIKENYFACSSCCPTLYLCLLTRNTAYSTYKQTLHFLYFEAKNLHIILKAVFSPKDSLTYWPLQRTDTCESFYTF